MKSLGRKAPLANFLSAGRSAGRSASLGASLVAALAALGSGCGPIETKIPSSTVVEVPGSGILTPNPLLPEEVFPADLIGQALAQSIQQSFDTSGYDKERVSSLKLSKLTLTVTNPEEQGGRQLKDLSFLQKLTVFLGAPGEPLKVAESEDGAFAAGTLSYDMPMTGAELADAFKSAESLEMSAEVQAGNQPQFQTDVGIDSELTVQISIF